MSITAHPIYVAALAAIQDAEELGGTRDGAEYIALMKAIGAECTRRAETARMNQITSDGECAP